jgi:cytochrome P450
VSGNLDEVIAGFRPTDPDFISAPYESLAALREATPIFFFEPTGQWYLTRFAAVSELLRDRRVGRSFNHRYRNADFGVPVPDPRWQGFRDEERWSLLELEPPDHTRIRRLITAVFTPSAVNALRPLVQQRAIDGVRHCAELDSFDLLTAYAQPYSVGVICSMLGVPESDRHLLLDWSHAMVKMYELAASDAQKTAATQAAQDFVTYVGGLIDAKRAKPDGLLISNLVAVEDGGDRLSTDEIISTVIVLLNAGHEATVNTLGNGLRALMHHRDQWERITAGEVPAKVAIEELLRFDPPLQLFERWVLDPIEVAGERLEVGSKVAMLFGSANHDPRRFLDPERMDVGRGETAHIGFGGGIHFCIGAPLARMELEVSLAELSQQLPNLQLAAEPEYHPTFVIRGLTALALSAS